MTTVVLTLATKQAVFPATTVDSSYVFSLTDGNGVVVSQETTDPHATFADVAVGDYTASVVKNGGTAQVTFSIVAPTVSLAVPDVLTFQLS